ncbi:hypothetical protein CWO04_00340 [Vibrio splendidus]|uniref:hypothetical protein n=1 Tax=Vibrio TaxID=662 RepID=UPI000C82F8F3|nr:hypothetical protein [Vibrio splendidus]PMO22905.1 hypothetical protein BCT15_11445 [Vibrio splendidus]PTP90671.1 hypothetical protein CWO04_00340 [Vibrio splendidus]
MYTFDLVLPKDSKVAVWALQKFLLEEAEKLLGKKELDKQIFQPTFGERGPFIRNRLQNDGAWAVLSHNAGGYWPAALYELAHETIHLLNPVIGYTNYLEEGIAVAYSIDMSKRETTHPMSPNDKYYQRAYELVQLLPDGIYESAKWIRNELGSLGNVKVADLKKLFPALEDEVIVELCSECDFT